MDYSLINRLLKTATPWGAYTLGALCARRADGAEVSGEIFERAAQCADEASAKAVYREAFPGEELGHDQNP